MTRLQIQQLVQTNLNDAGVAPTFFQPEEIQDSLQDGYNEIVCKSRCQVKKVTLNWPNNVVYFDFLNQFGVADYLGTVAILNNNTQLFLRDDVSLRDFDRLRRDWELWNGNAQFWAPHSLQYITCVPSLAVGVGTFTLWYWAQAPVFAGDTSIPIIATDMQILLELYSTIDLLESAEEPSKGSDYNLMYYKKLASYAERCKNLAGADVLQRI